VNLFCSSSSALTKIGLLLCRIIQRACAICPVWEAVTTWYNLVITIYKSDTRQCGERRKKSGNTLKIEYKGPQVLQQRFACKVILIANAFTTPAVLNALRAAAQEPRRRKLFLWRAGSLRWRPLTFGNQCPFNCCTGGEEEQVSSLHEVLFQGSGSPLQGVDIAFHPIF